MASPTWAAVSFWPDRTPRRSVTAKSIVATIVGHNRIEIRLEVPAIDSELRNVVPHVLIPARVTGVIDGEAVLDVVISAKVSVIYPSAIRLDGAIRQSNIEPTYGTSMRWEFGM